MGEQGGLSFLIVIADSGDPTRASTADQCHATFNYDEAVATCERALALSPGDPDLLWRLARVCIAIGEVAEGERREKK